MATEPLHFPNAPIIEALINIQVALLPESAIPDFRTGSARVRDAYPQVKDITQMQLTGEFKPEGPQSSVRQNLLGLQSSSADQRQLFQFRRNGFSFHRLAPYDRWETFRGEAFSLWQFYKQASGPLQIEMCSVRYINRLEVPVPGKLEDYVRVYPQIPPEMPQLLQNYLMRLEIPLNDGPGLLTLHQTMLPSAPGTASILLDNEFSYSVVGLRDEAVWERIDAARHEKNRVFLACITPAMKSRIS